MYNILNKESNISVYNNGDRYHEIRSYITLNIFFDRNCYFSLR